MPRPERRSARDLLEVTERVDLAGEIERLYEHRARTPILDRPPPSAIDAKLARELPNQGAPIDEVLDELERVVVAHARKNAHPGFFGYVCGPGLPTDPIAHALGAALNQNATGYASAPGAA